MNSQEKKIAMCVALCISLGTCGCTEGLGITEYCNNSSMRRSVQYSTGNIRSVTENGYIILQDGRQIRLAGIHMRTSNEVGEPDALNDIVKIISSSGAPVQITLDPDSNVGFILYKQPIHHLELERMYTHGLFFWLPKYHLVSVNELLIQLGMAYYDPDVGPMSKMITQVLRAAQVSYVRAVVRGERHYSLKECAESPKLLYYYGTGYRGNVATGDLKERRSKKWRKILADLMANDEFSILNESSRPT